MCLYSYYATLTKGHGFSYSNYQIRKIIKHQRSSIVSFEQIMFKLKKCFHGCVYVLFKNWFSKVLLNLETKEKNPIYYDMAQQRMSKSRHCIVERENRPIYMSYLYILTCSGWLSYFRYFLSRRRNNSWIESVFSQVPNVMPDCHHIGAIQA